MLGSKCQQPASYAQAKLADMIFRAKLRRLEFETKQGRLVEAEIVKQRWAAILVVLKERILATPDKLAPELTALTDERQEGDELVTREGFELWVEPGLQGTVDVVEPHDQLIVRPPGDPERSVRAH